MDNYQLYIVDQISDRGNSWPICNVKENAATWIFRKISDETNESVHLLKF